MNLFQYPNSTASATFVLFSGKHFAWPLPKLALGNLFFLMILCIFAWKSKIAELNSLLSYWRTITWIMNSAIRPSPRPITYKIITIIKVFDKTGIPDIITWFCMGGTLIRYLMYLKQIEIGWQKPTNSTSAFCFHHHFAQSFPLSVNSIHPYLPPIPLTHSLFLEYNFQDKSW